MTDKFAAFENTLLQPNPHSVGVMNLINQYYPAFAKKVLEGNPVMRGMAMYGMCSMNILNYPICNHCETLAAWSGAVKNKDGTIARQDGKGIGICTCWKCGLETKNPLTFFEWCLLELKKKAPPTLPADLCMAVDVVADRLLNDAVRIYEQSKKGSEVNYVQP